MIFILHGENLKRSRTAIVDLKQKLDLGPRQDLAVSAVTPSDFLSMCGSFDIFGKPPYVVLDVSGVTATQVKKFVEVLAKIPPKACVIILADKKLPKNNPFIKEASKVDAKVIESSVKDDSDIFKFVDAVFNKNRKASYKELSLLLEADEDPFKLMAMLVYGLRNIAIASFDSQGLAKMHPFVKSKALKQARSFSKPEILALYKLFFTMDKEVKQGGLAVELLLPLAIEKVLCSNQKFI